MSMDPFRKVRPGEAVKITATAWNALMGLLHPAPPKPNLAPATLGLPAVEARLTHAGAEVDQPRRLVVGEAVVMASTTLGAAQAATGPLSESMTLTSVEKRIWSVSRPLYEIMYPDSGVDRSPEQPIAICIDPTKRRFAVAGMAWTRVRLLRPWHRHARRCMPQPGDGAGELAASVGVLDSCGWGPAEIVGFMANGAPGNLTTSQNAFVGGSAGAIYWALVRI
jgi:hypothetical protein